MMYLIGNEGFDDFELMDSGEGYRLERWGAYVLARPDPQTIWERSMGREVWEKANAIFEDDQWKTNKELPEYWDLAFHDVKLRVRPMNFKHTGIFPEQAANWKWMSGLLTTPKSRVLNLFAYTGAATMVLTKQGAFVTHVDASRPAIGWAKDNQELNGLEPDSIRWMLEDAAKFVKSERKRGTQYDGIVMDPPAFGHGPTGKVWKFNEHMPKLLEDCVALLAPDARFLLINAYATNTSELAIKNLLEDALKGRPGTVEAGQLCLQQKNGRLLSTGIFTRWSR